MNETPLPDHLTPRERRIGQFFRLSVILKGIHALLEVVSGVALLFITPAMIVQAIEFLTQDELRENPNDVISNYFVSFATHLSVSSTLFASLYLLSHGIIKIALVWGLLRGKLWAYPASLVVLGLFIAYQMYRYTFTHSIGLIVLTVFDLVVLWLIWREYRIIKVHGGHLPKP